MFAKNWKCLFVLSAFALVAAMSLPKVSRAEYMVSPSTSLTQANCNPRPGQGNASYTIGYKFQVGATALNVTALGVEDDNGYVANGGFGDGLISTHVVTIWDNSPTPVALASVTVPSGTSATYNDGFRYVNLGTSLELAASGTYYIGAWFTDPISSNDTFYNPTNPPTTDFNFNSAVTELASTYSLNGSLLAPACPTSVGNPLGGWAGASAQFTLVPEPSTLILLGTGLLGLLAYAWRRRK